MGFTPSSLWTYFRSRVPSFKEGVVELEGVFSGFNSDREYGGKRYATFRDPTDRRVGITVRIPTSLVSHFTGNEGSLFTVSGVPYWDIKPEFGRAEVVFDVSGIKGVEVFKVELDEKAKILHEKAEKGHRDVEGMLRRILAGGGKPSVCIITGETSIVNTDFARALGREAEFYSIKLRQVNLSSEEALISALEGEDKNSYNLLALIRGGGSGLEVFNSVRVAKKVLNLKTPFVTALGHAKDLHLLDRVADRHFITPTDFGKFLREIALSVSETERIRRENKELQDRIVALSRENAVLKEKTPSPALFILGLVAGLMAGLVVGMLLR